jgi:hypothetical protein
VGVGFCSCGRAIVGATFNSGMGVDVLLHAVISRTNIERARRINLILVIRIHLERLEFTIPVHALANDGETIVR